MPTIPDFSPTELAIIQTTVDERYRHTVQLELADAEVVITEGQTPSECPIVFWQEGGTSFFVIKTGEDRFRCQFFKNPAEVFVPQANEFDNVGECAIFVLQAESDQFRGI